MDTTTTTMAAAADPAKANALINQALAGDADETKAVVKVKSPMDTLVTLPGGFIANGEVIKTVEVRELTGKDEEIISKATSVGRILNTILTRGTVKIGEELATEAMLNSMLAGDREAVLLGIHKVTFGNPVELTGYCGGCSEVKEVSVNFDEDIEMKFLEDPLANRVFKVQGRKDEYTVALPDGSVQKELQNNFDKTNAELSSLLLQGCVIEINGQVVYSKAQVQSMGLADRRKVSIEIAERNPGPIFKDVTTECPECGGEVVVPLNLGSLFQF
jgi:hypothetical protein